MELIIHKRGDLNAVIKSYQNVVSIKPDYFEAYNNMGSAFEDNCDLDLAIEAYKKDLNF